MRKCYCFYAKAPEEMILLQEIIFILTFSKHKPCNLRGETARFSPEELQQCKREEMLWACRYVHIGFWQRNRHTLQLFSYGRGLQADFSAGFASVAAKTDFTSAQIDPARTQFSLLA